MTAGDEEEQKVDPSYLYLSIRGDFDAVDFVSRSGLEFESSWTKGERSPSGAPFKFSACRYSFGKERYDRVSELVESAEPELARISPKLLEMAAVDELKFMLVLVVKYPPGAMGTGIQLSCRMTGLLSALSALFDADIYLY